MADAENAISVALGCGMDGTKIAGWTNDELTGQLKLLYNGPEPVSSENITVIVVNANP